MAQYDDGYWLADTDDVHREAGLSRSDISTLNNVAVMQAGEEMRRQFKTNS